MVEIRGYKTRDYGAVRRILETAGLFEDYHDLPENLEAKIRKDSSSILVAEEESKVVGVVFLVHDGWASIISHLAVDPASRSKNYGALLMKTAEEELAKRGANGVSILVDGKSGPVNYHEKRGYLSQGRYWLMIKPLVK